jgi:hypothetical protein
MLHAVVIADRRIRMSGSANRAMRRVVLKSPSAHAGSAHRRAPFR